MATKYTFTGTAITGTSKSGKLFKSSGITAYYGNTYLNVATGRVYKCVEDGEDKWKTVKGGGRERTDHKGSPKQAKWAYTKTIRIGPPVVGVTSLKLVREAKGSRKMKATWKVPDALLDKTNGRRADGHYITWVLDTSSSKKKNDIVDKEKTGKEAATSDTEDLAGFTVVKGKGKKKTTRKYARSDFYPFSGKPELHSVSVTVTPYNTEGKATKTLGKKPADVAQKATYKFEKPAAPTISSASFDTETGVVSFTITSDAGEGQEERYDTWYELTYSRNGRTPVKVSGQCGTTRDLTKTVRYDATGYQSLGDNDYICVKVRARCRGFKGDSGEASGTYYLSKPRPVTVGGAKASSRSLAGKVTVGVKVTASTQFPVDRIELYALVDSKYARAADIVPGEDRPDGPLATDNGNCTALVAGVADLMPKPGNHTWVFVKAWHANEDVLYSYSNVMEVKDLFTPAPTATDDKCEVLSAEPGEDGESIAVAVGYDRRGVAGDEDATGTQVGWSVHEDAWTSTEQPDTFDVDWAAERIKSGEDGYDNWIWRHRLIIRGLEEGGLYHVRARRYLEDEDRTTYGAWSDGVVCQTTSTPPSVVLSAPRSVEAGSDLQVSWVLASLAAQTEWQVFSAGGELGHGEGPKTSCRIAAGVLAEKAVEDGVATLKVRCSTGGEWVESDEVRVTVAERPDLMVSAETLTTQTGRPAQATIESSQPSLSVAWALTAQNAAGAGPDGSCDQYAGDTVADGLEDVTLAPVAWAASLMRARLAEAADAALAELEARQADLDAAGGESGTGDAHDAALAARDDARAAYDAAAAAAATEQQRYTATLVLGSSLNLHDKSSYELGAVPTDPVSGLAGERASAVFEVDWAHKAPAPPIGDFAATADAAPVEGKAYYTRVPGEDGDEDEYVPVEEPASEDMAGYYEEVPGITVEPYEEETEAGDTVRGCALTLVAPAGAAEGDVYDVYRVTHDGAELVSPPAGYALDYEVRDPWAPFGDAGDYAYRVVCRTADGDVRWADFDYFADPGCLRIDWGGSSVELPYNLAISDGYAKDAEVRTHMDGTVEGFHNPGVRRTARLSTDVVRVEDARTAALVRTLARHAGTAYVRTPDGSAYEAVVQVGGMDVRGPLLAVSIDAQEVSLSGAHLMPAQLQPEDEQEGA